MRESKFEIKELIGIGFTLIVLGIAITYGLDVVADQAQDFCDGAYDHYSMGECYTCNSSHNTWISDATKLCTNATAAAGGQANNMTPTQPGSEEFNATLSTTTGIMKITDKMGTIATVIVASVVIGILVTYLWTRFS